MRSDKAIDAERIHPNKSQVESSYIEIIIPRAKEELFREACAVKRSTPQEELSEFIDVYIAEYLAVKTGLEIAMPGNLPEFF